MEILPELETMISIGSEPARRDDLVRALQQSRSMYRPDRDYPIVTVYCSREMVSLFQQHNYCVYRIQAKYPMDNHTPELIQSTVLDHSRRVFLYRRHASRWIRDPPFGVQYIHID